MPAPCGYRDLGVEDTHHLVFLDTGLLREVTDFPTHLGMPVSSYPNVVLALHAYTHIYTLDKLAHIAGYPPGGYDQSYSFAEREARAMDAALFVSEFGNGPSDDDALLAAQVVEQETHRAGFAFWTWKENGSGGWGVFAPPVSASDSSGCLRAGRERYLARVYPQAIADPGATFHYDAGEGLFYLHASGRAGAPSTIVYVPPEVGGQVTIAGGARGAVSSETDGSRLILASPTGGPYSVAVAPGPAAMAGCA